MRGDSFAGRCAPLICGPWLWRLIFVDADVRAEKDADQRRRDALTLVAAEHARKMKEERAAAELRQKHAEMEAAKQAAIDEAERVARAQAEELAAFEREQLAQLEAERLRQQRERDEEEERKQLALQELERQRRIAEKRREQKELVSGGGAWRVDHGCVGLSPGRKREGVC